MIIFISWYKNRRFLYFKVELLISSEDEYLESDDGVLSLKYPKEPTFSRNNINRLYISGYIRQKIFYFNFKDELTGTLMIGKIPKNIINDKKNYSTCIYKNYIIIIGIV